MSEDEPPDGGKPVKAKRQRPDVAERLKSRKGLEYSSVVMKLSTLCKSKAVKEVIEVAVMNLNKIAFEAYHTACLHVVRCLEQSVELPTIDQNFFYRCCAGIVNRERSVGDPELDKTISLVKLQRPSSGYAPPEKLPLALLMCDLARQMRTNYQNHVVMNFGKRLLRMIRLRYRLKKVSPAKFLEKAFSDDTDKTPDHLELQSWLQICPSEENIKTNLGHFLQKSRDILRFMESQPPNTKWARTFSLLPLKGSYVPSHITISNSGLQLLLQLATKTRNNVAFCGFSSMTKETFDIHKEQLWREIFDIGRYETRNRRFAFEISTNGYAVSLKLQKPKPPKQPKVEPKAPRVFKEEDYNVFIGLDPGVTYLCTTLNDRNESHQLSTKRYRHEAQMKKHQQWHNNLRNKRSPEYSQLCKSLPSFGTASLERYVQALQQAMGICDRLFAICAEQPFRKWRFKAFIYSQKTMVTYANELTKGCQKGKALVGFGDWSKHDGIIKKHPTAPVKKFRKLLGRYATVEMIDEYRTSKACSLCGHDCKKIRLPKRQKDGSYKLVPSHQVVRCSNNECTMCWQRDRNSSINHLNLLMCLVRGHERPTAMRRAAKPINN